MSVSGTVYTETVVYSAPEAFAAEAPYQTAIVDAGRRRPGDGPHPGRTGRHRRPRGRRWRPRDGVPFFRKQRRLHETRGTDEPDRGRVRLRCAGEGPRARSAGHATSSTWRSASRTSPPRATSWKRPSRRSTRAGRTTAPPQGQPELREAIAQLRQPHARHPGRAGARLRGARRQADHLLPHAGAARAGRRGDLSRTPASRSTNR